MKPNRVLLMVLVASMTVGALSPSAIAKQRDDHDRQQELIERYSELVRGTPDVQFVDDSSLPSVVLEGGPAVGRQVRLSDELGEFNAATIEYGDFLELQVFDPDKGLTAFSFRASPDGSFQSLGTGAEAVPPSSSAVLSTEVDSPRRAKAQVSATICLVTVWPPYKSGAGFAVGPAEISNCNKPAILRLRIWLQWIFSGSWLTETYLDQQTYGTYFYRNALADCRRTLTRQWRTKAIADMVALEGGDAVVLTSVSKLLACDPTR